MSDHADASWSRMIDADGWEFTLHAVHTGDVYCPTVVFCTPYDATRYRVADLLGRPLEELYDPTACVDDPERCLDALEERLRAAMRDLRAEKQLQHRFPRDGAGTG